MPEGLFPLGEERMREAAEAASRGEFIVGANCPACKSGATLFRSRGGYLVCSNALCPAPNAAYELLDQAAYVWGTGHQKEPPAEDQAASAPAPSLTEQLEATISKVRKALDLAEDSRERAEQLVRRHAERIGTLERESGNLVAALLEGSSPWWIRATHAFDNLERLVDGASVDEIEPS